MVISGRIIAKLWRNSKISGTSQKSEEFYAQKWVNPLFLQHKIRRKKTYVSTFAKILWIYCTVCFLKTIPSATCVLWIDIKTMYINRVYSEETVFTDPAVPRLPFPNSQRVLRSVKEVQVGHQAGPCHIIIREGVKKLNF